ncbi:EscU/YscU/HrcU family type III secretion system export apparatus switch protein [Bacillus sp. 2205SS5-2]|uniref:EscU/YscU/HrcU family type III secretion system export apparatus switch protein n=1 Tax=Bacillus sp. 2205SS5-2 TaxID=3109031 RepID=UPI0030050850
MNPDRRKKAVALKYEPQSGDAPKVVAKGNGLIADTILSKANEFDIPIQEDKNLVELLGQLDLNHKIPEDLYEAVAEVFAFVYKLDSLNKEK